MIFSDIQSLNEAYEKDAGMNPSRSFRKAEQSKLTSRKSEYKIAVSRKGGRAALSSVLAVFLTFTLTFSSFAWAAANDVSDTIFTSGVVSDIPADDAQNAVVFGSENTTNEIAENDVISQGSNTKSLDDLEGNTDDESLSIKTRATVSQSIP